MTVIDGITVARPLHRGPHDLLVLELAAIARDKPGCRPVVNATVQFGGHGRGGPGHRSVDLLIRRGDTRMIVEVKTDLQYPYMVRRAVEQVRAYGELGKGNPVLVVVARDVPARMVGGVHVLNVGAFLGLFDTLLPPPPTVELTTDKAIAEVDRLHSALERIAAEAAGSAA